MNDQHITALQNLVDDKGFIQAEDARPAYDIGARGDYGHALCILRPNSTEQVSRIVSYCATHDIHIIPQSGNTGLVGGSIADDSGTQVLINLERMNKVHDIDVANASIHVDAGTRLSTANNALESNQYHIPIDLGSDPCIGGMISTNTGGSRYLKYRGMREQVMGLKAVLADKNGTIVDMLCPLHKNNTGFDTKQLFIGSCGSFGIITEAIIRVSPLLQQRASALLIPSSMSVITDLLIEIEKSFGSYLSAFEGMSKNAMRCALNHCPSLSSPFGQDDIPDYAILIEISRSWPQREAEQELDDVLESTLANLWENSPPLLDNALIGSDEKLWALRHGLSEGVQKSGTLYAFDISVKRSDIIPLRLHIETGIKAKYGNTLTLCDFGHVGDGALHCALVLDKDDPRGRDKSFEKELREWVNDQVVLEFGGSYSAEHALGRKVQDAYNKYTPAEIRQITRQIKQAIAPAPIGTVDL